MVIVLDVNQVVGHSLKASSLTIVLLATYILGIVLGAGRTLWPPSGLPSFANHVHYHGSQYLPQSSTATPYELPLRSFSSPGSARSTT